MCESVKVGDRVKLTAKPWVGMEGKVRAIGRARYLNEPTYEVGIGDGRTTVLLQGNEFKKLAGFYPGQRVRLSFAWRNKTGTIREVNVTPWGGGETVHRVDVDGMVSEEGFLFLESSLEVIGG